jgi:hypothetical protein
MYFHVALCRKQVFFVKMTQGEDYSEFVKGIRERLATLLIMEQPPIHNLQNPLISYHPLDPEEVIQSLTLKLVLLRLSSCCL